MSVPCYQKYSATDIAVANYAEGDNSLWVRAADVAEVEREIAALREQVKEAQLQTAMREGTLHMTVARLGGFVEGRPTERVNFLQRVDELRAAEAARDTLRAQIAQLVERLREPVWRGAYKYPADLLAALLAPVPAVRENKPAQMGG